MMRNILMILQDSGNPRANKIAARSFLGEPIHFQLQLGMKLLPDWVS
jgi:hypothetical protein